MSAKSINPLLLAINEDKIEEIPKSISIEISTRCSLNCKYCKHEKNRSKDMSFEEFLVLKDKLDAIKGLKNVTLCGIGESFLNKDVYRMIEALKDYSIAIVTSGTVPIDFEKLNEIGNVNYIIFSIDATSEEKIKTICGETYKYENLEGNIQALQNINRKKKRREPHIYSTLNCTVTNENIDEIPLLIEYAKKNKFTTIHYSIEWKSYEMVQQNREKLEAYFSEVEMKAKRYGIMYMNPITSFCCKIGDDILPFVDIKGNVYPCGYGLNKLYIAGNIFEHSFQEVWEGEKYQAFNCGSLCKECCTIKLYSLLNEGGQYARKGCRA